MQELLHRSCLHRNCCCTGAVVARELLHSWRVPEQPYVEIVRVGRASVSRNALLSCARATSNSLRRSCASDAQTCGDIRICLVPGSPLRRSCMSDAQTCGEMRIFSGVALPFRTTWRTNVKNCGKIAILKFQMQPSRATWRSNVKKG